MSLIRKIAGTFTFKVLGAGLNFLLVVLISRYLGPAGKGETSLLIANISSLLLGTGILGGTALIYLTPRTNVYLLLLPAYAGAFLFSLAGALVFYFSGLGSADYCRHLGLLALLLSLFSVNTLVLLGKEQVLRYNQLTFLVPLLTGLLLVLLFLRVEPAFASYRLALYGSYGALWVFSWYYIWQLPDAFTLAGLYPAVKQLCRYGFTGQLANILSFLNHRLSFYLLHFFISVEAVGLYSVGVSVSEGLWLVGRSIALVQYARIANSDDAAQSARETAQLARLSLWLTVLALLLLLALPAGFYRAIFGPAFGPVRQVILALSPGIAAVSLGNILIHFFSGLGHYQKNVKAAGMGLALFLPTAYVLIPGHGLWGAALATSLSQLAAAAYLVRVFHLQTGFSISGFLPRRQDLHLLRARLLR
jgi:O-antigen/teichoic acid export membrane protein